MHHGYAVLGQQAKHGIWFSKLHCASTWFQRQHCSEMQHLVMIILLPRLKSYLQPIFRRREGATPSIVVGTVGIVRFGAPKPCCGLLRPSHFKTTRITVVWARSEQLRPRFSKGRIQMEFTNIMKGVQQVEHCCTLCHRGFWGRRLLSGNFFLVILVAIPPSVLVPGLFLMHRVTADVIDGFRFEQQQTLSSLRLDPLESLS